MRSLYTFLLYLATPLILMYLAFRGIRDRGYAQRWAERFGFFPTPMARGGIAVHAVSMGEVNAASALLGRIQARYPAEPLCVTTFTPTGSNRVRSLFGDQVFHVFAPLDLPGAVRRFFDRVQPRLLIIMETELWPNLYEEAARRHIPVLIANARISEKSFSAYRRLRRLVSPTLGQVKRIGAQSEQDASRLLELGAPADRLSVTGNLKFDIHLPRSLLEEGEAIRRGWGSDRLVLLAGSTHEGDEGPLLEAFRGTLATFPEALLVLVPRHPERFGRAAQMARAAGLEVTALSEQSGCPRSTQCFVVDAMGELLRYYAACDVAFVGGSLDAIGGHNVLEPAALAKTVLVGPHTFNFTDITQALLAAGAALRIADAAELETEVCRLFADADLRDRMGRAGRSLVLSGQGAVEGTLELIEGLLTPAAD
jgi:3-deoxy-D-manno-octulosonic-acid transferase